MTITCAVKDVPIGGCFWADDKYYIRFGENDIHRADCLSDLPVNTRRIRFDPDQVVEVAGACLVNSDSSNATGQELDSVTEPHPDDEAVDRFAYAMKQKLADARAKGRSGWQACSADELSRMLREHVDKGDPRDVANFCMFLWHKGVGISAAPDNVDHELRVELAAARDLVARYEAMIDVYNSLLQARQNRYERELRMGLRQQSDGV